MAGTVCLLQAVGIVTPAQDRRPPLQREVATSAADRRTHAGLLQFHQREGMDSHRSRKYKRLA